MTRGHEQVQLSLPRWIASGFDRRTPTLDRDDQVAMAIALARANVVRDGGGPFGAVVFDSRGHILGVGVNRVQADGCSLAHAEMLALAFAQQRAGRPRLHDGGGAVTLACSAQPCTMCYGALFWAGIDRLRIAARAEDVIALAGFDEGPLPTDWSGELGRRGIAVERDILRDEARAVLASWADVGGARY